MTLQNVVFETVERRSLLTGRVINVNCDASRIAIMPSFSQNRLSLVAKDVSEVASALTAGVLQPVTDLMSAACKAQSQDEFACLVDALVDLTSARHNRPFQRLWARDCLNILWKHGLIAFPAGGVLGRVEKGHRSLAKFHEVYWGALTGPLRTVCNGEPEYTAIVKGADEPKFRYRVARLFLCCGGAQEPGDVDEATLEYLSPFLGAARPGMRPALCDAVWAMHTLAYSSRPEILSQLPDSYRSLLRTGGRNLDLIQAQRLPGKLPADACYVTLETTPVRSAITGRTVHANYDSEKFAVLPDFDESRLAAAKSAWESNELAELRSERRKRVPYVASEFAECAQKCFWAKDREGLGAAIEQLLTMRAVMTEQHAGRGERQRATELLWLLWRHGLVAFPAGRIWRKGITRITGALEVPGPLLYGKKLAAHVRLMAESSRWTGLDRKVPRVLFTVFGGAEEVGDIDEAALLGLVPHALVRSGAGLYPRSVSIMCDVLRTVQLAAYADDPEKLRSIPQSYEGVFRPKQLGKADPEFQWAREYGERIDGWREALAEYLSTIPGRMTVMNEITSANLILDYAIENADAGKSPIDYCREDRPVSITLDEYIKRRNYADLSDHLVRKRIRRFFARLLKLHLVDKDGRIPKGYRNPLSEGQSSQLPPRPGQTDRHAIPVRFLRLMKEIIVRDDYAWPKTIPQDWLEWHNPDTGRLERVWSPVRAYYFQLRLTLPLRGLQARLLDSGEGDPQVFRPEEGGWVRNTGRWASAARPPHGFLRRIWDHGAGCYLNGLYITTNKTADRIRDFVESGYEIPWQNPEVIELFVRMRDWQERFNSCTHPLTRAELSDPTLQASADVAARLEKLFFLFRDAAVRSQPMEPLSSGRANGFWVWLCEELEAELERQGVTNGDGSKIELVTRNREGLVSGSVFDPHSLRVAGLTAFAAAGVPIEILSEFVAGHATILMTLYYQKRGAAEITAALDEAIIRMSEVEQTQWAAWLKDLPLEELGAATAVNSPDALADVRRMQSGLWSPMTEGFCPNGGTKCNVGGPLVDGRKKVYSPVPGGARNCALCRFLVSGPAFLPGLVAKFNSIGVDLREALLRVRDITEKRAPLLVEQNKAQNAKLPFDKLRKLNILEEELVRAESEAEVLAQTWQAVLALVRRCEAVLERRTSSLVSSGCGPALVFNGTEREVRAALTPGTAFELFDRVCLSAELFDGIDARLPALRRGRLYDALLGREGRPPIFAALSDDQLIAIGNEFSRLLRSAAAASDVDALVEGRETLNRLGLVEQVDSLLASVSRPPLLTSSSSNIFSPAALISGD